MAPIAQDRHIPPTGPVGQSRGQTNSQPHKETPDRRQSSEWQGVHGRPTPPRAGDNSQMA